MNYKLISTHRFEKELKRLVKKYPSLKREYGRFIEHLSRNPKMGIFIGNNCYKIRLAIGSKGRGKSGGARMITYLYFKSQTVYLLTVYDKGEKVNLKSTELKDMIDALELENTK